MLAFLWPWKMVCEILYQKKRSDSMACISLDLHCICSLTNQDPHPILIQSISMCFCSHIRKGVEVTPESNIKQFFSDASSLLTGNPPFTADGCGSLSFHRQRHPSIANMQQYTEVWFKLRYRGYFSTLICQDFSMRTDNSSWPGKLRIMNGLEMVRNVNYFSMRGDYSTRGY